METVRAVAAVIERDGRIFAAHRPTSRTGAAGWEFPGGKIEEGETPEAALAREVSEELGAKLSVMWYLDTVEHDYPTFHLSMDCLVCELAEGSSVSLTDHDDLRWLARDELLSVEWLPADETVARMVGTYWDHIFASTHL